LITWILVVSFALYLNNSLIGVFIIKSFGFISK